MRKKNTKKNSRSSRSKKSRTRKGGKILSGIDTKNKIINTVEPYVKTGLDKVVSYTLDIGNQIDNTQIRKPI